MTVDIGTIGSSPSQMSLNMILIELNDQKMTHVTMSRYSKAKCQIARLNKNWNGKDKEFYKCMLRLLRKEQLAFVDELKCRLPKDLYTHLRCCVVGLFKEAGRTCQTS